MNKKNITSKGPNNALAHEEPRFVRLAMTLINSDWRWLGSVLLNIFRFRLKERLIHPESGPKIITPLPTGPFVSARKKQSGDLLLWVPRRFNSYLIDDLTGGYGYSHSTIDTGEIDLPTLKPVMAEITVNQTVTRKFQDEYGQRAFVRIPVKKTGVDAKLFMTAVKSKMGESYDNLDALTLGEIKDPAKEVCSGLVADCLPEGELKQIAWAKRMGLLRKSSVSVHSRPGAAKTRIFVSPNGFAEYYGAPNGRAVSRPDTVILPQPVTLSIVKAASDSNWRPIWKFITGVLIVGLLIAMLHRTLQPYFIHSKI